MFNNIFKDFWDCAFGDNSLKGVFQSINSTYDWWYWTHHE